MSTSTDSYFPTSIIHCYEQVNVQDKHCLSKSHNFININDNPWYKNFISRFLLIHNNADTVSKGEPLRLQVISLEYM